MSKQRSKKTLMKGLSAVSIIPYVDIIHHFAVDAMHCVWEGIVKMLLKFWFSHQLIHERIFHWSHFCQKSTKDLNKHASRTTSHAKQDHTARSGKVRTKNSQCNSVIFSFSQQLSTRTFSCTSTSQSFENCSKTSTKPIQRNL